MYEIIYEDIEENREYEPIIKKVIEKCFEEEKIQNSKLCMTIILTTPQNIRKINKEYSALIGLELLEGESENADIRNIKQDVRKVHSKR